MSDPAPKRSDGIPWPAALAVIGLFVVFLGAGVFEASNRPPSDEASKDGSNRKCRSDLRCWAKKYASDAEICLGAIEKITEYEFKWTNGLFEPRLAAYGWHKQSAGTLTYSGDALLVQSATGAFARMAYECDYDPIGHAVLAVRLRPGRLAQ